MLETFSVHHSPTHLFGRVLDLALAGVLATRGRVLVVETGGIRLSGSSSGIVPSSLPLVDVLPAPTGCSCRRRDQLESLGEDPLGYSRVLFVSSTDPADRECALLAASLSAHRVVVVEPFVTALSSAEHTIGMFSPGSSAVLVAGVRGQFLPPARGRRTVQLPLSERLWQAASAGAPSLLLEDDGVSALLGAALEPLLLPA